VTIAVWSVALCASRNFVHCFVLQPAINELGVIETSIRKKVLFRRNGQEIRANSIPLRVRNRYDDDFRISKTKDFNQNAYFDDDDGFEYDNFAYDEGSNVEVPQRSSDTSTHFFSRKEITDPTFSTHSRIFQQLCNGAGIEKPSRIQALSWPALAQGESAIVADQTGSGKTLAYLLPVIQTMLLSKNFNGKSKKQNGSPRVLILAPTAELADQIKPVCDSISASCSNVFSTKVITATGTYTTNIRDQIRMINSNEIDVLITTPGRIATILRSKNSGFLDLSNVQSIILDEVDVLLIDETFGPQLRTIGAATKTETRSSSIQFVFVTATLPDSIVETVTREFPNVRKIKGPGLHRVSPTVTEHLVDVSVPSEFNRDLNLGFELKAKMLMKALRANSCKRTLVFCNTVESCRKVENLIKRSDRSGTLFEVGAYHNAMKPEARNKNLGIFSHGLYSEEQKRSKSKGNTSTKKKRKYNEKSVNYILICTDRAARGVDFEAAPVDHVIIFDFPKDPAEYVRRVGRTGRAGREGQVSVFAYGWQLPIARKIMKGKLDTYTVAVNEDDDEYVTRKRRKRSRESSIGKNIEGGHLWK